jgi:MerR family copper efflux transcriptional regulator
MLIGELAQRLGVTRKTLRYYETVGLVPPAERARSGYRTYPPEAVRRAQLVVGLRKIGLSLEQIQTVLTVDGRPLRQRLMGVLDRQIQEEAIKIAVFQGRHDDLEARYHALLATPRDRPADCICDALGRPCDCPR